MISTSEIAVSCVIEDKYAELAVRALHDAFELERERPTPGDGDPRDDPPSLMGRTP
jgi:aspartate kinase